MKIAIDGRGAENLSGIGVATESMIRNLLEIDSRNEYILIRNQDASQLPGNCRILQTQRKLTEHPRGDYWFHVTLPEILKREGVDAFWGPGYLVPLRGKGFRRVVTFCDLSFHEKKSTFPILTRNYFRFVFRRAAEKADRIIAISEFTKSEIGRVYGRDCLDKTRVIHLDCDDGFRSHTADGGAVREKYRLERPYFLFVGNLEPRKNLSALIDAFRILKRSHSLPHALVIVGQKAWMYSGIFAKIRDEGLDKDVILTGYVEPDDLRAIYAGSEAFVYPSLYEGFGIPILEAMAIGVPVVASNRASIPEVSGDAALLFDPGNPEELSRCLLRILKDPAMAASMRAKGKARVAGFSWRASARRLLDELQACG
jgi:glycosyltransferase involved in cell wall biosynthesis